MKDKLKKLISGKIESLNQKEREALLNKLRDEVDFIDEELVKYFNKRTIRSVLIGRIKRSLKLPTYNPEREKEISVKISKHNEGPLSLESLQRIYERIIDESRAIQKEEEDKGNFVKINISAGKLSLKNLLSKKELMIVLSFFFAVLIFLYYVFFTGNYYEGESPQKFDIRKGATLNQVIDSLYEKGIIPSKFNMKVASMLYGAERRIIAGRYLIENGLSYIRLVELLVSGNVVKPKLLPVYDGISMRFLSGRIQRHFGIDSAKVFQLMNDTSFVNKLNVNASSLEGYLLPGDYFFYDDAAPEEILLKLNSEINKLFVDSLQKRIDEIGFTMHEVITLASIIEGETNIKKEMPTISGVYHNRLKIGMALQADPTIQYVLEGGWRRLLYRDLEIDSPYNTYKYSGLPPGPINNPGRDAIIAALYPEEHDFYFFVADGKGGHKFTRNYQEHLRAVREYREWLRQQNRK